RVEDGQPDDRDPRAELLQRSHADDRSTEEDELHQVAVLAQERVPARLRLRLGKLVRADLGAPLLHFGRVEPGLRVDAELRADLLGGQVVPRDRRRGFVLAAGAPDVRNAGRRRTHRAAHASSRVATITALMVCSRFSDSSKTSDAADSKTSSVTSSASSPNLSKISLATCVSVLWNAGRQCMNFTSGLPVSFIVPAFTW